MAGCCFNVGCCLVGDHVSGSVDLCPPSRLTSPLQVLSTRARKEVALTDVKVQVGQCEDSLSQNPTFAHV
jgi:hypothetical protein